MTNTIDPAVDGQTAEPVVDERDRLIRRQELAIAVMRDRILELEMELINTRCALNERT